MTGTLPAPGAAEDFTMLPLAPAEVPIWYHVYSTERFAGTTANSFAKGWGDTRFAPLAQADGTPVHTFYAASTPEVAYLESVLHDVALAPPGMFEVARLRHYFLAQVRLAAPLQCVQFHTPYLPRLGLTRAQLIDSPPACYAHTRAWAQAAYLQRPAAQAIAYGSRRHDAGRCLVLFQQRLPEPPFDVIADEWLAVGRRRAEVLALVRSLALHEV